MIQLGPLGLTRGLKRIKNLIVEEISLVDKPAIRRQFLLIKRDSPNEVAKKLEQLAEEFGLSSGEIQKFSKEQIELLQSVPTVLKNKGVKLNGI